MKHALMLAIVLGQASGNLAYAGQDGDTQARVTGASLRAATGSSSASTVKSAPALSFEGAQDDKIVRGQIGVQYGRFTLTAGAKTNVTKGAAERPTTLADLDGLRNKTTGEFSLYGSHWLGRGEDPNNVLDAPCNQFAEETGKKEGTDFKCRLGWFAKDSSAAGRRAYDTIIDALSPRAILFVGGNGNIAPEEFKFVGKTDLKVAKEMHTSWSVSGVAGIALKTNMVIAASYRRAVAYQAGDKAQVCSALGSTGSTTCAEKVLGGPGGPDKTNVVSFEVKQFFGGGFAVAPKINRDFTNGVTGIQIPIYVLQDKNGGLTGGITLGWRSDTKAFTASAFVGPVLRLLTKS